MKGKAGRMYKTTKNSQDNQLLFPGLFNNVYQLHRLYSINNTLIMNFKGYKRKWPCPTSKNQLSIWE